MRFADDAALTAPSGEALQRLVNRNQFAHACREFGLTISLKKTNVIARDASQVPSVKINDYTVEVVQDFTYLGSNISNNLSLDTEINRRIGKAAVTMAKLSKRVWENKMLTENTKMRVYQHSPLWKRIVDHIHVPGAPPQHLPHAVPQAYPRHHMAGPYPLQRHIGPCQDPQHVFTAEPETPALVGPCTAHGGRPLAERHPLWTTHQWREASGMSRPQIQGRLQARLKGV